MPPYEKNPDFQEKYPETQTRPKKPRSSGKNPAVVTLSDIQYCHWTFENQPRFRHQKNPEKPR